MTKTDVQILKEAWGRKYSTQPYETHHLKYNYEDLVLEAMREVAKQEAIEFHVFVEKNYQPITASGLYMEQYKFEEGTPWPDLETIQKYSLNELYQLFIQSKQK